MNKNTKVLALKYRPQTFDDLIGQDVIAETILNSIKSNKVPNAYLFTGIRGVGKTTTARIVLRHSIVPMILIIFAKRNFVKIVIPLQILIILMF